MTAKSDELVEELVSACIAFGRQVEPDWQTRIEKARSELKAYIAELEAERLELRKTLGWAYDLDEYKDNPEVQKMYNKFNQNHRSKNERQILQER